MVLPGAGTGLAGLVGRAAGLQRRRGRDRAGAGRTAVVLARALTLILALALALGLILVLMAVVVRTIGHAAVITPQVGSVRRVLAVAMRGLPVRLRAGGRRGCGDGGCAGAGLVGGGGVGVVVGGGSVVGRGRVGRAGGGVRRDGRVVDRRRELLRPAAVGALRAAGCLRGLVGRVLARGGRRGRRPDRGRLSAAGRLLLLLLLLLLRALAVLVLWRLLVRRVRGRLARVGRYLGARDVKRSRGWPLARALEVRGRRGRRVVCRFCRQLRQRCLCPSRFTKPIRVRACVRACVP